MKRIRSFTTTAVLSLALLGLGVAGARAQNLSKTLFHGSFNLPTEAQWGPMTLPAGNYDLYYGPLYQFGINVVEVVSKAKKGPQTFILAKGQEQTSAMKSSLVCVREGSGLVIRRLEMAGIDKALNFAMPHGMVLLAQKQGQGEYRLAEDQSQIERISVSLQ